MWDSTDSNYHIIWVNLIDMFGTEHIISMSHITMIKKDKNKNRIIYVTSCTEPVIITEQEWDNLNLFSKEEQ